MVDKERFWWDQGVLTQLREVIRKLKSVGPTIDTAPTIRKSADSAAAWEPRSRMRGLKSRGLKTGVR